MNKNVERGRIKIGTRKSALAMWQATHVANLLKEGGFQVELIPIETKGDKIQNTTFSKIGSKGVFTQELEEMLRRGQIDLAVHSAKDIQSRLPDGLYLLAFCEREACEDVIVAEKPIHLENPHLVLGTSSNRRKAMIKRFYPHIKITDVRGNVPTRIAKIQAEKMDGLVLAHAGVKRLNLGDKVKCVLDPSEFVPPVGQGAIAIEAHRRLEGGKAEKIKKLTNHPHTETALSAERSFLAVMDGGCSIPVFGHAQINEENRIQLTAGILGLDGREMITRTSYGTHPEMLGSTLAEEILANGGKRLLKEIKSHLSH